MNYEKLREALGDRAEEFRRECTRDVIFLLESRRVHWFDVPAGWTWDASHIIEDDTGRELSGREADEFLLDCNCALEAWNHVSVFGTRAEAEAFGVKTCYRYPSGWRVYGICLDGLLAEALRPDPVPVAAIPAED